VRGLIVEGFVCSEDYHGKASSTHGRLANFSL